MLRIAIENSGLLVRTRDEQQQERAGAIVARQMQKRQRMKRTRSGQRIALITGGAGFIGSHLADELLREGYAVRVLDRLDPQVHQDGQRPEYLDDAVELIQGDVTDLATVMKALEGVDYVYHFAAKVGVGQSMYQIREYTNVNTIGTACLLEALLECPVKKLIVASSMSVYGEGSYLDGTGKSVFPNQRTEGHYQKNGSWDFRWEDGELLRPQPTAETKPASPASIYAQGKYDQERMCLIFGEAYGVPTVALRFFNVYGTRQALSNPYTGVLAIFASRLMNDRPPLIFEDGEQRRDFVQVRDVARACRLALESDGANGCILNIGSGEERTINDVAASLIRTMGRDGIEPEVTGRFRAGDVRHCYADTSRAEALIGYKAEIPFDEGLAELVAWLEGQIAVDRVEDAQRELTTRGLAK